MELLGLALRVSIMYAFALLLLRLDGKRELGELSPFDFVVTVVVGDMFDDIFWAEVSLAQGLTGFAVIVLLHMLVAYASWKSALVARLVCSTETPVVQGGAWQEAGLRRERTRQEDVLEELRELGEDRLEELKAAYWEPNGQLSALKQDQFKSAEKRDRPLLRKALT